jgi:uncharacterized membrane protein HdeD (DUF308 family)
MELIKNPLLDPNDAPAEMELLARNWGWIFAVGLAYLVLGIFAFSLPLLTTIAINFLIASVLIFGGALHLAHSIKMRRHRGAKARFFQSNLAIIIGLLMWIYPGSGMTGIAFALGFYFFLSGAAQWVLASAMRPQPGWALGRFASVASYFLGVMIFFSFPFSAVWVPGTLLGVDLIVNGAATAALAIALKNYGRKHPLSTSRPAFAT